MKNKEQVFLFLKTQIEQLNKTRWGKAIVNEHWMAKTQNTIELYNKNWANFWFCFVKYQWKFYWSNYETHYQGWNWFWNCVYVKHIDNPYSKPEPFDTILELLKSQISDIEKQLQRTDKELEVKYKNILRWTIEYFNNSEKILTLF